MYTENYHAHIIANRIGPNGKANDLWHERIKRERTCAEIAAERGWEIVVGRITATSCSACGIVCAAAGSGAAPERRRVSALRERGELPWQDRHGPTCSMRSIARRAGTTASAPCAHGVVVKLVRRSGRVRGLAFAEGSIAGRRDVQRHASMRAAHCRRSSGLRAVHAVARTREGDDRRNAVGAKRARNDPRLRSTARVHGMINSAARS